MRPEPVRFRAQLVPGAAGLGVRDGLRPVVRTGAPGTGEPARGQARSRRRRAASVGVIVPARSWRSNRDACSRTSSRRRNSLTRPLLDGRPHPRDLLLRPVARRTRRSTSISARCCSICAHTSSSPASVAALQVSTGGIQARRRRVEQLQRASASSRAATFASRAVLAVGLVDGEHVGELEHALLDALQRVAGAGEHQHEEAVDHVGDDGLRLADADRLDEHDVVAGGLHEDDRLARRRGDAAERARRRRRADERASDRPTGAAMRVLSPRMLPPVRVDEGSTASTATRWPSPVSIVPRASMNVDLPTPGTPVMPTRWLPPALGQEPQRAAPGRASWWSARRRLDERDRPAEGGAGRRRGRPPRSRRPRCAAASAVARSAVSDVRRGGARARRAGRRPRRR